ncbi:MAG: SDR family oxidoreductase [Thalassovita sp.]
MQGKTCLITGASSGIGEQTAYALADQGADLILVCRNQDKGVRVATQIHLRNRSSRVDVVVGDFSSLEQVRKVADEVLTMERPLHVLLNNAGVFNFRRTLTVDGHEEMFAVNHLAHFLLTNLLLERLKQTAGARVVTVGSGAHKLVKAINFEDLSFEHRFRPLHVYSHSKLANGLFGYTLAQRLQGTGVTSNVVDPGEVSTNLGVQNGWFGVLLKRLMSRFLQSPKTGAETSIYACSAPVLQGVSGQYLRNSGVGKARRWAMDDIAGDALWEKSAALVAQ